MHNDHIKELTEKQVQRIFVEQMFKEGKNQVGMEDYQIRGWNGFHNHMALCMMAMLLIAKSQFTNRLKGDSLVKGLKPSRTDRCHSLPI